MAARNTATTDQEREATLRLLNEEASAEIRALVEAIQHVDTKLTFVAGFAAAAFPFLLGNRRGVLWTVALVCYGVSFGVALIGLWPRRRRGLRLAVLYRKLGSATAVFALTRLGAAKIVVFESSHRQGRWKTLALDCSGSHRRRRNYPVGVEHLVENAHE